MDNELFIRQELLKLLSKPELDYNRILSLSSDLAKCDQKNVRFSVDAELISRLGNELVARQETALSELVKNAYDADATKVTLKFLNTDNVGGTLIIEDNGEGMDRDQIINGFMRISSNMKVENPKSEIYHRKKAGKKGIGRFAVQRLGNKLDIQTKTEDAKTSYNVKFDWNDYQATKDIYEISNEINIISPHTSEKGTTLVISGLKDKWSEAAIKRIYRYLEDILQPVSEFNDNENNGIFELEVYKDGKKVENQLLQIDSYSIATITGEVDSEGNATMIVESGKLGLRYEEKIGYDVKDENSRFTMLKNTKVKAYYFLESYLPKGQVTAIQKFLNLYGGVRLYRNGYRVLPYGEPANDWLKLDFSLQKRTILPQHGNNNFRGIVNINDDSGNFEETSSREGLLENESFIQLQNFVYRTLVTAVIKVAKERNVKITTSQKKIGDRWAEIDVIVKNIAFSIDELDKVISNNQAASVEVKQPKHLFEKLKKDVDLLQRERNEERKQLKEEQTLLRVLSSVGLTTEQFVHEIKYYLGNISSDIDFIRHHLEDKDAAEKRIDILDGNFANFKTYVSYFDAMVAGNVNRELVPCEMRTIVRRFVEAMEPDAEKAGLTFEVPQFFGYNLYSQPMHPSEWTSILFNFYTNSKKAIKRAHETNGRILITAGKEDGNVYIEFSDNGDGIPTGDEDKIFERFYTTTATLGIDDVDSMNNISGSGLGLSIVKDICISNKGMVFVVSAKGDYSTCFRVEIPALTDKEIDKML